MKLLRPLALFVTVALLGACHSGAAAAPKPQPTRLGEIPEAYRELWKAWLLRDPRYTALREAALQDPHQTIFLVENLVSVLLGEITAGRVDTEANGLPTTLGRVRRELVEIGPQSAPALAEVLPLGLGLGPVAVEDLLVQIGSPAVGPILEQLKRKDSDLARRRAAKALAAMADRGIPAGAPASEVREALGQCLLHDSDWIVRSQSALALAPWGRRSAADMADSSRFLVPSLKDPDASVRTDVVHALARLGDPRTFPAMINHLERSEQGGDMSQAMLTQAALCAMTRRNDAKTPEAWRAWWRDARPKVLSRFLEQYQDPTPKGEFATPPR
ncbi:MAG: HEAT repeat domain-containing protein [Planctomycetes bacterium]|nr:HEAT repeat domain-containing protein [Planctomycetota bacterium]MCB9910547.1 HEAT repeat domain-containing protein [Planctomycetota bacterium]